MATLEIDSYRDFQIVAQALSIDIRIQIMELLQDSSFNVNEIAERLGIPVSTATVNIKKLEDADLIKSEVMPGKRGSQKLCSRKYDQIKLGIAAPVVEQAVLELAMPIGNFVACRVEPTCGLVSEKSKIGEYDDASSFYLPEKVDAQLIWVGNGYLEYNFPNRIDRRREVAAIEFSAELCSEAPFYKNKWPSDITLWINGQNCGHWTAPGDFGGKRGKLNPKWWGKHMTQYGELVTWRITPDGTYINNVAVSNMTLKGLGLNDAPFIPLRIGTEDDARNRRGFNIFGSRFGNYSQDIRLKLIYV